jgi:HJR/Mrr/RecB family endonuclease
MTFNPKQYDLPDDFFNTVQTEIGIQVDIDDGQVQKAFELMNELSFFRDKNFEINLGVGVLGYAGSIFLGFMILEKTSDVMALSLIGAMAGFFYSSLKRDSEENKIRSRLAQCISGNVNTQSILEKKAKLIQSNFDGVKKAITALKTQLDGRIETGQDWWSSKKSYNLEKALSEMFTRRGFVAQTTKGSGDGGIDVIVENYEGSNLYIQCKGWDKKVGPQTIRELAGVITTLNDKKAQGVVLSINGFSEAAIQFGSQSNIWMWDKQSISEIAKKYPVN